MTYTVSSFFDCFGVSSTNVTGRYGIVDHSRQAIACAVESGVVWHADGHEVRPETTDPPLAYFGEEESHCYAHDEKGHGVEKVDEKGFEARALVWSLRVIVYDVELEDKSEQKL